MWNLGRVARAERARDGWVGTQASREDGTIGSLTMITAKSFQPRFGVILS